MLLTAPSAQQPLQTALAAFFPDVPAVVSDRDTHDDATLALHFACQTEARPVPAMLGPRIEARLVLHANRTLSADGEQPR